MKMVYHSALKPDLSGLRELESWQDNGSKVFANDIAMAGINNEDFASCDVFYSEPAWKDGYEKFIDRANQESNSYLEYVLRMVYFIQKSDKPVYLVLGAHVLKEFRNPNLVIKIKLHGYPTNLCIWNDNKLPDMQTNYDVIEHLATRYSCVGDFNAGYGNTARIFQEHGKSFVCSDINKKCVYYIAKTLMGYDK